MLEAPKAQEKPLKPFNGLLGALEFNFVSGYFWLRSVCLPPSIKVWYLAR